MLDLRNHLFRFWNFWPPFLFSGIKITRIDQDYRLVHVKLKLRFWNANYVKTQYGGSIFSMADPFYMVMLIKNLGPEYLVWDKSSTIRYLKPGRSDLFAEFSLSEEDISSIKEILDSQGKMDWVRKVQIKDKEGIVVAEIEKTVNIKKKIPKS